MCRKISSQVVSKVVKKIVQDLVQDNEPSKTVITAASTNNLKLKKY